MTMCSIAGCGEAAIETAAPGVGYCRQHAAANQQTTRDYMANLRYTGAVESAPARPQAAKDDDD